MGFCGEAQTAIEVASKQGNCVGDYHIQASLWKILTEYEM
jgi:hypothetical protein